MVGPKRRRGCPRHRGINQKAKVAAYSVRARPDVGISSGADSVLNVNKKRGNQRTTGGRGSENTSCEKKKKLRGGIGGHQSRKGVRWVLDAIGGKRREELEEKGRKNGEKRDQKSRGRRAEIRRRHLA